MNNINQNAAVSRPPPLPNPIAPNKVDGSYREYISQRQQLVRAYAGVLNRPGGEAAAAELRRHIDQLDHSWNKERKPLDPGPCPDERATRGLFVPSIVGKNAGVRLQQATAAGAALPATRHTPGQPAQSYLNCGLESCRQVINLSRARRGLPPISEDELLAHARKYGELQSWNGSTFASDRKRLMSDYGVASAVVPQTPQRIQQAVGSGCGVIVGVDPGYYWTGASPRQGYHAVVVTGVDRDEQGRVVGYIINDTGVGKNALHVPKEQFERALNAHPRKEALVTGDMW